MPKFEDRINCEARGFKLSLKGLFNRNNVKISGHLFQATEVHDNVTVFVEKCEDCGHTQLSWMKPGPMAEDFKRLNGLPYDRAVAAQYRPIRAEDF